MRKTTSAEAKGQGMKDSRCPRHPAGPKTLEAPEVQEVDVQHSRVAVALVFFDLVFGVGGCTGWVTADERGGNSDSD